MNNNIKMITTNIPVDGLTLGQYAAALYKGGLTHEQVTRHLEASTKNTFRQLLSEVTGPSDEAEMCQTRWVYLAPTVSMQLTVEVLVAQEPLPFPTSAKSPPPRPQVRFNDPGSGD